MKPIIPFALVGLPPQWFPHVLSKLLLQSLQGRWTECQTVCVLTEEEITTFCTLAQDSNPIHKTFGKRKAIVPGMLVGAMLPALMPDIYAACGQAGVVYDMGGVRFPVGIVKAGMELQARIRVVAARHEDSKAYLDILAEIYTPAKNGVSEVVRARVTQALVIKQKKNKP